MPRFTYTFDELQLIPNYLILATGEADIEYSKAPAEPDIGASRPYATDIEITAIVLSPYHRAIRGKNSPPLNLSQDHWLYPIIYKALLESYDLLEACDEDMREDKRDY